MSNCAFSKRRRAPPPAEEAGDRRETFHLSARPIRQSARLGKRTCLAARFPSRAALVMPQKRNPLGLENVLRATGEVSGKAVTYLIESQNFWSGSGVYKSATPIEVTRASGEMYQATADVLGALVFYPDRALERVNEDYGATTELADELQRDENVPFRVGHHFASELVTFGRANNLKPAQLPYAEAQTD